MLTRAVLVSTVAATLACAGPASATLITWAFEGQITFVTDRDGILGGQVNVGDTFSGSYTFESTTPDSDANPRRGIYSNALTWLSGTVGAVPFEGDLGLGNLIDIKDNSSGVIDQYLVNANARVVSRPLSFSLALIDSTGMAFANDALPLIPPDVSEFQITELVLSSEASGISIRSNVAAIVPETSTSLLVVGAFLVPVLCWRSGVRGRRTGRCGANGTASVLIWVLFLILP